MNYSNIPEAKKNQRSRKIWKKFQENTEKSLKNKTQSISGISKIFDLKGATVKEFFHLLAICNRFSSTTIKNYFRQHVV
jgi:hypothetical protein